MSSGMNKVILIGNLGQDVELRTTTSGMSVADLRLATSERRKQGEEWVDHTEWHTVTVFGKTAENCAKFLVKGRQVAVEGRLQTDKWQDKTGADRWTTKVVANDVTFLGGGDGAGKAAGGTSSGVKTKQSTAQRSEAAGEEPFVQDDDIPF